VIFYFSAQKINFDKLRILSNITKNMTEEFLRYL